MVCITNRTLTTDCVNKAIPAKVPDIVCLYVNAAEGLMHT